MNSLNETLSELNHESRPSRREFAKLLGCAMLTGAGVAATRPLATLRGATLTQPKFVARTDEIPVGGYKLFRYPTENDPSILVRLGDDHYAAFSQSCTHLMCPVYFQPEKQRLACPCHDGFFNAVDGAVLAGPPRRALPSHAVEVRDGQIWVSRHNADRA